MCHTITISISRLSGFSRHYLQFSELTLLRFLQYSVAASLQMSTIYQHSLIVTQFKHDKKNIKLENNIIMLIYFHWAQSRVSANNV